MRIYPILLISFLVPAATFSNEGTSTIYLSCEGQLQTYTSESKSGFKPKKVGYAIKLDAKDQVTFIRGSLFPSYDQYECRKDGQLLINCGKPLKEDVSYSVAYTLELNRVTGEAREMRYVEPFKTAFPSQLFEGSCTTSDKTMF